MSTSVLESLPPHLLEAVCEFIANCEPRRTSLFAFSLASKTCCRAAWRQRTARVFLCIRSPAKLRRDLRLWQRLLNPSGTEVSSYGSVRLLTMTGFMSLDEEEEEEMDEQSESFPSTQELTEMAEKDNLRRVDDGCLLDPSQPPITAHQRFKYPIYRPKLPLQEKERMKEAWEPLAQFVSKLAGLADLVHACLDQLPPSVLSALHRHCPRSRLHMRTFSLRCCFRPGNDLRPFDKDDLAIATSPCLHTVVVDDGTWHRFRVPAQGANPRLLYRHRFDVDVVQRMIRGLAPQLRSVHVLPFKHQKSVNAERDHRFFREVLPSRDRDLARLLSGIADTPSSLGQLTVLSLHDPTSMASWGQDGALNRLESLTIQPVRLAAVLSDLTELGRRGCLPCLRDLIMSIDASDASMDHSIRDAILAVPPLRFLGLTGHFDSETYAAIRSRHSGSLHKLILLPHRVWSFDWVIQAWRRGLPLEGARDLARECTQLEELTHHVSGSSPGTLDEDEFIQSLGSDRRLKKVIFAFDMQDPEGVIRPVADSFFRGRYTTRYL